MQWMNVFWLQMTQKAPSCLLSSTTQAARLRWAKRSVSYSTWSFDLKKKIIVLTQIVTNALNDWMILIFDMKAHLCLNVWLHFFTSLKSWNDWSSTVNRRPWGCGISMLYACLKYYNRFLAFLTHYYWISTVQCVTVQFFLAAQILFVLFSSFSVEGKKCTKPEWQSKLKRLQRFLFWWSTVVCAT